VKFGVFAGSDITALDTAVERAREAARLGFDAIWYPQTAGLDALTALAVVAREVPELHLGTAVVPIQGRHPIPLALQALTVADAAGPGRFTLGLGVTHAVVSEGWFGIPYRGIVDVCAEVLDAVGTLLGPERRSDVDGDHVAAHLATPNAAAPPGLVLAGLGPRMLDLAGRATDGTVTWMTGPTGLRRDVVPRLRAAAEAAGRAEPRVVVGIPVCVTDDPAGARQRLAPMMARVATMPSYRRQVAAEGVAEPVDLVLLGDGDAVAERLDALVAAGTTELCANVVGEPEEQERTRRFLADHARR
jgi:5,10-methylenetetrahydromethanopterin reductase